MSSTNGRQFLISDLLEKTKIIDLFSSGDTSFTITPFINNILATLVILLYSQILLGLGSVLHKSFGKAHESRKFVHIGAASWLVFWPLFDTSHWSWKLNVVVPGAIAIKFFFKGTILADPNDPETKSLCRTSSPTELLFGPLQFGLAMVYVGLYHFMTLNGVIIMGALGMGDGMAPLIGERYGKHLYRSPFGTVKSYEGSIFGVFFFSVVGCYIYSIILGLPSVPIRSAALYGMVAAITEGLSPGNVDNVLVPLALRLFMSVE